MNKLAEHLFRSALSVSPRRLRVPPPRSHQLLGACGSAPPREPPGSRQVRLQQVSHRLHTFTQPSEAQASFPFRYWGCAHTAAPLLALSLRSCRSCSSRCSCPGAASLCPACSTAGHHPAVSISSFLPRQHLHLCLVR